MIHVRRLIWDEWNVAHIVRHEITPDKVEEICHGDALVQEGKKGRVAVVGSTREGKMVTVFLDPEEEPGVYYPVTARPASRKERRLYRVEKGGENQ